jgi:hypothetical protein
MHGQYRRTEKLHQNPMKKSRIWKPDKQKSAGLQQINMLGPYGSPIFEVLYQSA